VDVGGGVVTGIGVDGGEVIAGLEAQLSPVNIKARPRVLASRILMIFFIVLAFLDDLFRGHRRTFAHCQPMAVSN